MITTLRLSTLKVAFVRITSILLLALICFAFAIYVYITAPPISDWQGNYYPAIHNLLSRDIYTSFHTYNFFNAPWIAIPLLPFVLLPPRLGNAVVSIISLIVMGFVAHKRGANPISIFLLLTMPQTLFMARNGGIDWLISLGFILPPPIGLFFVLAKPQIGVGIAVYWFFAVWREGGLAKVMRTFSPVVVAYLLAVGYYGPAVIGLGSFGRLVKGFSWDASIWPYSIPVGLALLVHAIRSKKESLSILSGPFFAPYIGFYSWPVALLGLLPRQWETLAAVVGMWVVALLQSHW